MLKEINIWMCLLLFAGYFVFDVLYAKYIIFVQEKKAVMAATMSALLLAFSMWGVLECTKSLVYLLPILSGAWLGSYWIIKREKRNSETEG